jgi:hypothetical protein
VKYYQKVIGFSRRTLIERDRAGWIIENAAVHVSSLGQPAPHTLMKQKG